MGAEDPSRGFPAESLRPVELLGEFDERKAKPAWPERFDHDGEKGS